MMLLLIETIVNRFRTFSIWYAIAPVLWYDTLARGILHMLNGDDISYMAECMSFWKSLTDDERDYLVKQTMDLTYEKGSVIHNDRKNCTGVMLVVYGRLRVYIVGDDGKEITLYRLVERDVCVLSASCVLRNITFDVHIQAEEPTRILNIPVETYRHLEQSNQKVQDFTNQLVSSRFSDVMWVMEQLVFMSMDKRLAIYLLEQSALVGSDSLKLTHEAIAHDLGTAREVVTRLLKYFQDEKMVTLARGEITIIDHSALMRLSE